MKANGNLPFGSEGNQQRRRPLCCCCRSLEEVEERWVERELRQQEIEQHGRELPQEDNCRRDDWHR